MGLRGRGCGSWEGLEGLDGGWVRFAWVPGGLDKARKGVLGFGGIPSSPCRWRLDCSLPCYRDPLSTSHRQRYNYPEFLALW